MAILFFLLLFCFPPPLLSSSLQTPSSPLGPDPDFKGWRGRGKFSNMSSWVFEKWRRRPSFFYAPSSLSPTPYQVFTCHWLTPRFPWRGPHSRQSSCFPRSREAWRPACMGKPCDTRPGTTRPSLWRLRGCHHAGSPTPLCRSMQEEKSMPGLFRVCYDFWSPLFDICKKNLVKLKLISISSAWQVPEAHVSL